MELKECEKYKKQFLIMDILNIVACACVFLTALLFAFVELFQIKFEEYVLHSFSVFSEFKDGIGNMKDFFENMRSGESDNMSATQPMTCMISIIAFGAVALVMLCSLVEVIKNGLSFLNYDKKLIIKYDKIKRGVPISASSMVILCVLALIVNVGCIIVGKNINKIIGEEGSASDYELMNGVSWTIMFIVIFFLAAVVLLICAKKIYKDINYDMVKNSYVKDNGEEKSGNSDGLNKK